VNNPFAEKGRGGRAGSMVHPITEESHGLHLRSPGVIAVVVSYQPKIESLKRLLDSLRPQVAITVVVDNGSDDDVAGLIARRAHEDVRYIGLGANLGLAAGQNVGIRFARESGATYVILFDQDSEPAPDMVAQLVSACLRMGALGHKVGAMGPRYVDPRQDNPPPFIQIRGFRLHRQECRNAGDVVHVDYLVSSGCLIPMTTVDAVGMMRDDLFIDYVDIEWGLRARSMGFQCFGVCDAIMEHQLGEAPVRFMGKMLPIHTPLRHYYHFRNAVWMYRQNWPPLQWKVRDAYRLPLKFVFYSLMARPRLQHIRMMALGVLHGLCGRMGPARKEAYRDSQRFPLAK
jgi:rhamnosyltransferase